jgi:hypothetical protein
MAALFLRDGYVRGPILARQLREGWHYRKGWELRISLPDDPAEIERVQRLLVAAEWTVTEPYRKGGRVIVPIYGRARVEEIIEAAERLAGDRVKDPQTL